MARWPVIDRALTFLQEQQMADPQAIAGIARQSALQSRQLGYVANQAMLDRLNQALQESVAAGEGAREWSARMRQIVGGRTSYEETISRTATHRGYLDGQRKVQAGPVGDLFPYRQYIATNDTRVDPEHWEFDGKVYHKDSPMAREAAKRLQRFNCRCREKLLRRKQAEKLGIDDDTGWVQQEREIEAKELANPPVAITKRPVARLPDRRAVYEADGLYWTRRPQSQVDAERVIVYMDVAKLDRAWSKGGSDFYIPRGGGGAEIGGRRAGFEQFVTSTSQASPVEFPRVTINRDGSVTFEDGRHRTSVLRDQGKQVIPVLVDRSQLARAKHLEYSIEEPEAE